VAITAPTTEIGYTQTPNYNWWLYENETTPELIWPQSVYVYDQMRRQDAQVGSVLRAVTETLLRTPWRIDPAGARARVVKFVADDLGLPIVGKPAAPPPRLKDRFSWPTHLREALLMLPMGHSYFEQVYRVNEAGTAAHLRKLAYRPSKTIERIDVAPDGGLVAIKQWWTTADRRPEPIPVNRLVAYIHAREGGNWLGTSILRNCYKNWLLKDRLLRVQAQTIERNGMGIPLYTGNETETDLSAGLSMATKWRAGEAAGSAIPFGSSLKLVGVEGTLPDAEPAIRYHDEQIARAVLAHFLNLGTQTGSWALGSTFADFFVMSLQTLAEQIRDTATSHIIEDLVDINFGENEPAPRLVFDEIGSRQAATAAALKTLVDAGVIRPDEVLEESSRQQYGLPPADPATVRTPPAPTGPQEQPPTQTGDMSTAVQAAGPAHSPAGFAGAHQLHEYWTRGEGLAKWASSAHPWTELYHHLLKYIHNDHEAKATAAAWYHDVFGTWPGSHDGHGVHAKFDPSEPRDPHSGKWGVGGAAGTVLKDSLKLAGEIDLGPDEKLVGSGRVSGVGGSVLLAAVDSGGKRRLRVGMGNAAFGGRRDGAGPWRGGPGDLAKVNAERKKMRDESAGLEAELVHADPGRAAAINKRLDALERMDLAEVEPNGHTVDVDAADFERFRVAVPEAIAKAKRDFADEAAFSADREQLVRRIEKARYPVDANGRLRPWTPTEEAAYDALVEKLAELDAEPPGIDPDHVYLEGVIPGTDANLRYRVVPEDTDTGVQLVMGALPHDDPRLSLDDLVRREQAAVLDPAEAGKFLRLLDQLGGGKISTA
jgi:hypothetical protein